MKKLIALLLALVMVFSVATLFAGCDDDSKKSSKSEDKDDEDEDEGEDETTVPEGEGDETTAPEGEDDPTDPVDDPTEPEPTEPEPTEDDVTGELMDAPDITFSDDIELLGIVGEATTENGTQAFEIAMQETSDEEGLVYYCDETVEVIFKVSSDGIVKYVPGDEKFVEDTATDSQTVLQEYYNVMYVMSMFIDTATMLSSSGAELKYEKVEVSEVEGYGDVAKYNVYNGDQLFRILYVQVESGVTVNIADGTDTDIMYCYPVFEGIDLTAMI